MVAARADGAFDLSSVLGLDPGLYQAYTMYGTTVRLRLGLRLGLTAWIVMISVALALALALY